MQAVIDSIVGNLKTFIATPSAKGGCSDIVNINAVYWGDPGIIPLANYPCLTVQPERDVPISETTGYEVRDLHVMVTLLVDSRDYFDKYVDEATGDRVMVQTMLNLRRWFRRASKRTLDQQVGVREVKISETKYVVQVRGSVIAKSSQISLVIDKQYPRQQ